MGKLYIFNTEQSRQDFLSDDEYSTFVPGSAIPYDNIQVYVGAWYPLTKERDVIKSGVDMIITVSNPDVATVSWIPENSSIDVRRLSSGTTTITLTPADGSGVKASIRVTFQ